MSKSDQVDTVSNNLANSDTVAFKKEGTAFREYLSTVERENWPNDIPRGPIKDRDLYPLDGRELSHVITDGTYTNFRQGNLRITNNPLDFAISGTGFFEVSTPEGVRLTRQGSFKLAKDGQLVTPEGFPVLASIPEGLANAQLATAVQPGQGGLATQGGVAAGRTIATPGVPAPETVARFITLRGIARGEGGRISVAENGDLYVGERKVASLSVAEFADLGKLRKGGNGLFSNPDPQNRVPAGAAANRVSLIRQGMLEMSNVNPVEEMTKLIKAHRGFEHDMKAIQTYDAMMRKEVNEIGKY